jgi:trk system potassium uptake protein TrkH
VLLAEHRETYWVAAVMVGAALLYAWTFRGMEQPLAALGEGLVNGISLVSTTGFDTHAGSLEALPDTIALFLAIAGGAALSTAGGLKLYRIGAMAVQSLHELKRLVFPHSVRSTRFGSQPYDLQLMKAIWANLVLSLAVIVFAALLLALQLPTFDAALEAAVAAFSNIGPLYSDAGAAAPLPAYHDFSLLSKLVTIATMILGRIEVIVLFAAVSVVYSRT